MKTDLFLWSVLFSKFAGILSVPQLHEALAGFLPCLQTGPCLQHLLAFPAPACVSLSSSMGIFHSCLPSRPIGR